MHTHPANCSPPCSALPGPILSQGVPSLLPAPSCPAPPSLPCSFFGGLPSHAPHSRTPAPAVGPRDPFRPQAAPTGAALGAKCRNVNLALAQGSKSSAWALPAPARPGVRMPARIGVRPPCHSSADFPPGALMPGAPLTQGEGQEQWQGADAAARGGPVHQPHAAGPDSPWTSLPPPPAPLPGPLAPEGGPGNYSLGPSGNETTSQAGTRASGQPNTRGGRAAGSGSMAGRREPPIYPGSFCTHPTGEARDSGVVASTLFHPNRPTPTPTLKDTFGLPSGQLTHSPCWVAPDSASLPFGE